MNDFNKKHKIRNKKSENSDPIYMGLYTFLLVVPY